MALPKDTTTLEALIKAGKTVTATYEHFSFLERCSNKTIISIHNVIWDYIDELKEISVMVKLTDEQMQRYKYRPKLLCYDIYGNQEIYFVIMALNNIADVTEFDRNNVRMLRKDHMELFISRIYNAESKAISAYNAKISE